MCEKFYSEIEKNIGSSRFEHCKRTAEYAKFLAKIHGANPDKAFVAGIFHDCGKWQDKDRLYEEVFKHEELSEFWGRKSSLVLHTFFGAILAEKKYGVSDPEILSAIRYHATGREDMTLLEKIVYAADTFEPGRTYEGVDKLREIAERDLDRAVLEGFAFTIESLVKKRVYVDPRTFEAYNYMMKTKGENW